MPERVSPRRTTWVWEPEAEEAVELTLAGAVLPEPFTRIR